MPKPPPSRRPSRHASDRTPSTSTAARELTDGVARYRATLLDPPAAWRFEPNPFGGSWVKGRLRVVATLETSYPQGRELTVSLSHTHNAALPSEAEVAEVRRAFIPPGLLVTAEPGGSTATASGRLFYLSATLVDPALAGVHLHPLAGNPTAHPTVSDGWTSTLPDGTVTRFSDALPPPEGWALHYTVHAPIYTRGADAVLLCERTDPPSKGGQRWREAILSRPTTAMADQGALWREVVAWAFGPRAYVLVWGSSRGTDSTTDGTTDSTDETTVEPTPVVGDHGPKAPRTTMRLGAVVEDRDGPNGGWHGCRWLQRLAARDGRLVLVWPDGVATIVAREAHGPDNTGHGWGVVTDEDSLRRPTPTVLVPEGGCWRCDLGVHVGEYSGPRAWRGARVN